MTSADASMPRFFFDTDDGHWQRLDQDGVECGDLVAARRHALAALPDMAAEHLPNDDRHVFTVRVRDEEGRYVFHATLTLLAEWLARV